jgi:hypothetical protein
MTRSELTLLTDCGHDLAAKVALAIIAAANVGPSTVEMEVDVETLAAIGIELKIDAEHFRTMGLQPYNRCQITLSFMEVDAVIYARVNR